MSYYLLGFVIAIIISTAWMLYPRLGFDRTHSRTTKSTSRKLTGFNYLRNQIRFLENVYPGHLGLYIRDLETDEEVAHRADEFWSLASAVKLPVAIEVLRQIDKKEHLLDGLIEVREVDYVDGPGTTNLKPVGTALTIRELLESSLIESDNTAHDILLRVAGLDRVNQMLHQFGPRGFSNIVSAKDLRRHIYGEIHPSAFKLAGVDFIRLSRFANENERLRELSRTLNISPDDFVKKSLHEAYMSFYKKSLNVGTLRAMAHLFEEILDPEFLSAESREFLTSTLLKVETGKRRVSGGLSPYYNFAHKTGTQYQRVLDFGLLWNRERPRRKPVLLLASTRGFRDTDTAEGILKRIGQTFTEARVLEV